MVGVVQLPIGVLSWPLLAEAAEGGDFQLVVLELCVELLCPAPVTAELFRELLASWGTADAEV